MNTLSVPQTTEADIAHNAQFVLDNVDDVLSLFRIVIEFDLDPRDIDDALEDIDLCQYRAKLWRTSPLDAVQEDPPDFPVYNLTWIQDVFGPDKATEYDQDALQIARQLVKGEYKIHRAA